MFNSQSPRPGSVTSAHSLGAAILATAFLIGACTYEEPSATEQHVNPQPPRLWYDLDDHTIGIPGFVGTTPDGRHMATYSGGAAQILPDVINLAAPASALIFEELRYQAHGVAVPGAVTKQAQAARDAFARRHATLGNTVLDRLSWLQLRLVKDHFGNMIVWNNVRDEFAVWANGERRAAIPGYPGSDMDQAYQWVVWAIIAKGCVDNAVSAADWGSLRNNIVMGLDVYLQTHNAGNGNVQPKLTNSRKTTFNASLPAGPGAGSLAAVKTTYAAMNAAAIDAQLLTLIANNTNAPAGGGGGGGGGGGEEVSGGGFLGPTTDEGATVLVSDDDTDATDCNWCSEEVMALCGVYADAEFDDTLCECCGDCLTD